jgi:hypothetical protein
VPGGDFCPALLFSEPAKMIVKKFVLSGRAATRGTDILFCVFVALR